MSKIKKKAGNNMENFIDMENFTLEVVDSGIEDIRFSDIQKIISEKKRQLQY